MNEALKRFTPDSNWISAGLLTLLVMSFGILAERQAGPHTLPVEFTEVICESDDSQGSTRALTGIRFH